MCWQFAFVVSAAKQMHWQAGRQVGVAGGCLCIGCAVVRMLLIVDNAPATKSTTTTPATTTATTTTITATTTTIMRLLQLKVLCVCRECFN